MHQRCSNPKCKSYRDYGARGISVTAEWRTFERFLSDMGMKPPSLQLERIDNNAGYSKANCRWASAEEQSQNRRSARLNPDSVREIRRLAASGTKGYVIAARMGASIATVSMVINRLTWKNIQ
jgi:hypothetical protein